MGPVYPCGRFARDVQQMSLLIGKYNLEVEVDLNSRWSVEYGVWTCLGFEVEGRGMGMVVRGWCALGIGREEGRGDGDYCMRVGREIDGMCNRHLGL